MTDASGRVLIAMSLLCAAGLLGACGTEPSQGEPPATPETFTLVSATVSDIDEGQDVSFSLTFNQPPDFFTRDQYNRVANDFQIYIIASPGVPQMCGEGNRPFASLVRGGEIYVAGDLPIRDDGPSDEQDPASGGWGRVRGRVPFTLDERTVFFSVSPSVLNVATNFGFCIQTDVFGGDTIQYRGAAGRAGLTRWPDYASHKLFIRSAKDARAALF